MTDNQIYDKYFTENAIICAMVPKRETIKTYKYNMFKLRYQFNDALEEFKNELLVIFS